MQSQLPYSILRHNNSEWIESCLCWELQAVHLTTGTPHNRNTYQCVNHLFSKIFIVIIISLLHSNVYVALVEDDFCDLLYYISLVAPVVVFPLQASCYVGHLTHSYESCLPSSEITVAPCSTTHRSKLWGKTSRIRMRRKVQAKLPQNRPGTRLDLP